jgi:mannosyl-3-phosphoglycerate phosphatase family protein
LKKLLFTDLDGTLLDLETYSPELVRASVKNLKTAGVSIIFCSSKTWAEQEHYLKELELDEPVIVENGSGIFLPENSNLNIQKRKPAEKQQVIALGKSYDEILSAVKENAKQYYPALKYYANLSAAEISHITGLPAEAALKAKMRNFSETLFNADPQSDAYTQFENALKSQGLQCISGSKYITITSTASDKGRAVKILIDAYQRTYGEVTSYGTGDSLNDFAMLEVVDFPYLVQKPDSTWADHNLNKLTKVGKIGPEGWKIIALEILNH